MLKLEVQTELLRVSFEKVPFPRTRIRNHSALNGPPTPTAQLHNSGSVWMDVCVDDT
ncbi:hypothetical protein FA13DRAFT_1735164 [Coprinellus micaceus]|uniref:Uncharacterized protein n=1 Tax=Coprinellus micaceus TaxID=71717 RepID=A0A4Y7T4W6_COPMI|nr:hypothetical protein FA13DRAFT_1735164 [Coprinellus micaceus]